jgi:protein O-mannosyl-transferase
VEHPRRSTRHAADIGFQVEGLSPWRYLLTQPEVLLHYLRLCFWPARLCLDYGWEFVSSWREAAIPGSLIVALLAITAYAMRRKPKVGALGAFAFLVLAPTSTIVPIKVFAFEHRMYLPLASIVVLVLLGGAAAGERLVRARPSRAGAIRGASIGLVVLAVAALGARTFARNADYQSATRMWADVVSQRPRNARAWNAYGVALSVDNRFEESKQAYEHAVALEPESGEYHGNLGRVLAKLGRPAEAVPHYRIALSTAGGDANLHHSLAIALQRSGALEESVAEYRETLRLDPAHSFARYNMGMALEKASRWEEAERAFSDSIQRSPNDPEARFQRCVCWVQLGRRDEAVRELEAILRASPKHAGAAQLLSELTRGR